MTTLPTLAGTPAAPPHGTPGDGVVHAGPGRWLRAEGVVLLTAALAAFAATHQPWWLVAVLALAPDLAALGLLAGRRVGAAAYNLTHAAPLPAAVVALGVAGHHPLVLALGLVGLAHIGMDRCLGYGLKYPDDPGHTHLGWHGPRVAPPPSD